MKNESKKLKDKLDTITGEVSIVQDDPKIFGDEGKKYYFLGGGCGFAFLEFDRRSKKAKRIAEEWGQIKQPFLNWFLKEYYTKETLRKFEDMGTPLEAVTFQDMSFNTRMTGMVAKYMEDSGIKNVRVRTHYD